MEENKTIQATLSVLIDDVRNIVKNGLRKAYQDANATAVYTYWQVGLIIAPYYLLQVTMPVIGMYMGTTDSRNKNEIKTLLNIWHYQLT